MSHQDQLAMLVADVTEWNHWREENPDVEPDLAGVDLSMADLHGANLWNADLHRANLWRANLQGAVLVGTALTEVDLSEADLSGANLQWADLGRANLWCANLIEANLLQARLRDADLREANLVHADLTQAILSGSRLGGADLSHALLVDARLDSVDLSVANLYEARLNSASLVGARLYRTNLRGAHLRNANLSLAVLVETCLDQADMRGCRVYGISAWDIQAQGAIMQDLRISADEPDITVDDDLEVAQFLYLLIDNKKIRRVIDTITSKVVLILGRFTPPRKAILDALRQELRRHDYVPVLFDFEKPKNRDLTEMISTLSHLARFVIADLTDPRSIPQELQQIVPNLPSVPVQPILQEASDEYGMFEHFHRYPWVLTIYRYRDGESLVAALRDHIIGPAEQKAKDLAAGKVS